MATTTTTAHWNNYYNQQSADRLRRLLHHARTQHPSTLRPHFRSLFQMLQRARQRPLLHPLAIDLITQLHPHPLHWGYWDEWLQLLQLGDQLAHEQNQTLQRLQLRQNQTRLLLDLGLYDAGLACAQDLLEMAAAHNAARIYAETSYLLVQRLFSLGRHHEAIDWLERLSKRLPALADATDTLTAQQAQVWLNLPHVYRLRYKRQYAEAMTLANDLLATVSVPNAPAKLRQTIYNQRAGVFMDLDQADKSAADRQQALAIARSSNDHLTEIELTYDLALTYYYMPDFNAAADILRQNVALCEGVRANWLLVRGIGTLAVIHLCQHQLDAALPYHDHHVQLAHQLQDPFEISRSHSNRGLTNLARGEFAAAIADLAVGEAYCRQQTLNHALALVLTSLSWCYDGVGQTEKAEALAQEALTLADTVIPRAKAIAHRCLAGLSSTSTAARRQHLHAALSSARSRGQQWETAASLLSLCAVESPQYWPEAVDLLQKMGATDWLNGRSPQNPPSLPLLG